MKDIDKFKQLFKEINQEYIESQLGDEIVLCSGNGGWDCCTFTFDKNGKFITMYGEG